MKREVKLLKSSMSFTLYFEIFCMFTVRRNPSIFKSFNINRSVYIFKWNNGLRAPGHAYRTNGLVNNGCL